MLISIDWVKDFVNLPALAAKEIYSRFTLATAEVEGIEVLGEHLEKIVIVEVLSIEKHPEADKLNLVTFKISDSDIRKVVCGANNVAVGIKVPFAPLGVKLPSGLVLEAKKIRGFLSEGMLCSEEELGFKEESEGLMVLPKDSPIGQSMLEYLNLKKDYILDIDNKSLTHRPDLWGHFGIAREFASIFDLPLIDKFNSNWMDGLKSKYTNQVSPISPVFEGDSAGISFYGISINDIAVGDSPDWLRTRLISCGIRSINNIVDISNYVMLELGLPLHIYDRDLISGDKLYIKAIESDCIFKTLDDVDRKLERGDTVISDTSGPLVLAGIMGGKNSGVSNETTNIFIEVANWKAALVRRTSTRLGLRTDSSQRFEKTLDSQLTERSLLRALELVLEICPSAKVVGKAEYAGLELSSFKNISITTSFSKIRATLGLNIPNEKIVKIFSSLEFKTVSDGDVLEVIVPSFRSTKDIDQEADLIEEIGRIVGYDNILPMSPLDTIAPVKLTEMQKIQRKVREFMILQGKSFEVMTYPLIGDSMLKKVLWPSLPELKLINSISVEHDLMRPSLIPSLLEVSELNAKSFDRFRFFELGRTYNPDSVLFSKESLNLGAVFFDRDSNPFIDIANLVSNLLSSLNLNFELTEMNSKFTNHLLPSDWAGVHPFENLTIKAMGKNIGTIFSVHPLVLRNLKIKGNLVFCVLDLSIFENYSPKDKIKYRPLNKFPSSSFDWTVVASNEVRVVDVLLAAKKAKVKELQSLEILDIFESESNNYVTLRAVLSDESATLSSESLKNAEKLLIDATSKAGFNLK